MLRDDLSGFEVLDLYKYFQNFLNFIGIDIAISSFWLDQKYLHGSSTPKTDGSFLDTKRSECTVPSYFQNTKTPQAGQGNTKRVKSDLTISESYDRDATELHFRHAGFLQISMKTVWLESD